MKIAVEGCAHGELENIYNTIQEIEVNQRIKVDLLICCGDFQSSRNEEDLKCMAVPPKYLNICSFYKYYNGEKEAPILTIFIGGNHEASNFLQELPYGGWVAPNIYYLGYAGVINIGGLRIAGLSGIYKGRDFLKGRFEKVPYDEGSKRSVYHIRNLEVFRLKQLSQPIDIFLSHDWPAGIFNFGNKAQLLKRKPFFREDMETGNLGSKPAEEILNSLKPKYWFAAHLHCKFAALVKHEDDSITKFLALDKCLPKRKFLQILDINHDENKKVEIGYDLEWLTILHLTNHLLNVKNTFNYMPGPGGNDRYNFTPTDEEKHLVLEKLKHVLVVPKNFKPTAPGFSANSAKKKKKGKQPEATLNPQTVELCDVLNIDDPICLVSEINGLNISLSETNFENTTFISDSDNNSDSVNEFESAVEGDPVAEDKIQIKSLVLPEPKNVSIALESEESCTQDSEEATKPNSAELPSADTDLSLLQINKDTSESEVEQADRQSKTSPKRSLNESVNPVEESSNEPNKVLGLENSPTPKKFKRRNADIYSNADSA